jgi:hypothetical protein
MKAYDDSVKESERAKRFMFLEASYRFNHREKRDLFLLHFCIPGLYKVASNEISWFINLVWDCLWGELWKWRNIYFNCPSNDKNVDGNDPSDLVFYQVCSAKLQLVRIYLETHFVEPEILELRRVFEYISRKKSDETENFDDIPIGNLNRAHPNFV